MNKKLIKKLKLKLANKTIGSNMFYGYDIYSTTGKEIYISKWDVNRNEKCKKKEYCVFSPSLNFVLNVSFDFLMDVENPISYILHKVN